MHTTIHITVNIKTDFKFCSFADTFTASDYTHPLQSAAPAHFHPRRPARALPDAPRAACIV
jgi:hypothetical protein